MTVRPASFPMVSKTIFESLDIFRLIGARESGFSSGGLEARAGSPLSMSGTGLVSQHFQSFLELLIGDNTGWIQESGPLKLGNGPLQISLIPEFQALAGVQLPGFKARLVQLDAEIGVMGIGGERLAVILHGSVIILDVSSLFAGPVALVAVLG